MPTPNDRLKRILTQQLRSLRQAGLTHVARPTPDSGPPEPLPVPSPEYSMPRKTAKQQSSDPTEALKQLCGQVAACTRCQELAETRTQTVFGVGNPQAQVVFVGEARLERTKTGRANPLWAAPGSC